MKFRLIVWLLPLMLTMLSPMRATAAPEADDWSAGNIISNADFKLARGPGLPKGWTAVLPNTNLAPEFKIAAEPDGQPALEATGDGREECFGYVRHRVHFDANKTYRFRVKFKVDGMDDINRHLVHGVFGSINGGIFEYRKEGDSIIGESRFPGPVKAGNAEVRLCFRFSPSGKVWWENVTLQECEPIAPRKVKVACSWGRGDMEHWSEWLDAAGQKKVDIALLPEDFDGKTSRQPQALDGPSGKLMSEKARQWHMYVTGTIFEKRDDFVFHTAPFFDREGKMVGSYCKAEPFDEEEFGGVTPGTNFPVFKTDFGKVGVMICYDSWFPEITRLLAYKGAELVLLPNTGYYLGLMPARAADNGVCIGASSLNNAPGIWDSSGAMAGAPPNDDPSRKAPTMISGYEKDDKERMIIATLDLSREFSPAWHEGPMNSAPGGRRARNTSMRAIEPEIARESTRWLEPEQEKQAQSSTVNAQ